nr:transposase domain-containing protein [Aquibacillus sediminis]
MIIYSIVKTAKENGLNPFNYLSYLFEELPNIDTTDKEQLAQYLPWSQHSFKNATFQINLNKAYTKSPSENRWGFRVCLLFNNFIKRVFLQF